MSSPNPSEQLAATPAGDIPRHVAIIMDGNGRWARQRGMPRIWGHRASRRAVREAVENASRLGISYLTLYTFSSENWQRPRPEVNGLMRFLENTLTEERDELDRNNVKLRAIGRIDELPDRVQKVLAGSIEALSHNTGMTLILALSYSGRNELLDATRRLAAACASGEIQPDEITQEHIAASFYAQDLPNPDLLIRTGGEMRISNFLLWQLAYAEIYFSRVMWPDFRGQHLIEAVEDYGRRERRFGRVE